MSRSSRRRSQPPDTDLPQYIVDAIRQAWPDGVVHMPKHSDDAPLRGTYPRLKASLSRIPETRVLYEREPQLVPNSDEGSRSYCLFFLSPTDERFEFGTDTLEQDEEGIERRFPGEGWMGCLVAISVVAPLAAVSLDEMEVFENGSRLEPDVDPHLFTVDMGKMDLESHFRGLVSEKCNGI